MSGEPIYSLRGPGYSLRETAASWVSRLASGSATPADVQALKTWLAQDPRNQHAFDRARRVWSGTAPLEGLARKSLRSRPRAIAAAVIVAAAACFVFTVIGLELAAHDFAAPVGEVRQMKLADGSLIWLDSGAAADYAETSGTRTLDLARGRIHISVAHESHKPFIVHAGGLRIRDVGTSFTVDAGEDGVRVLVAEGSVSVSRGDVVTPLGAGQAASFISGSPESAQSFNTDAESAWRKGHISLDRTRLDEALRQANRYRSGKILLLDSHAGARIVSGALSIDDLDNSLDALAASQGLRLIRLPGLLLVTTRQP